MTIENPQVGDWVPETKLRPPEPREELITRPRLLRVLQRAVTEHSLTIVAAPAGYGKSTLLSQWARARTANDSDTGCLPMAWLSLDESENGRSYFLLALIAALRTLHPSCGMRAQVLLTTNGYPEHIDPGAQLELMVGVIVIDILQYLPEPFVICLDGYERITEPTVHAVLDYLTRRLPPSCHLVLGTRHDPPIGLARLHVEQEVARLECDDLAFTRDEVKAYLGRRLAGEPLCSEVTALHHFTEGWPAGLRLVARELETTDPDKRKCTMGKLRDAGAGFAAVSAIERYFEEEVWAQQPDWLHDFLLQTCILQELTPEHCQAVSGRTDANRLLHHLARHNLFVRRDPHADRGDAETTTVAVHLRYHRLFATYLRRQLQRQMPEDVAELQRREAQAETHSEERVRRYLRAGMWEEAARSMEALPVWHSDDKQDELLDGWIQELPSMVLERHPDLRDRRARLDVPKSGQEAAEKLGLTPRELEVLAYLANGASNQTIGQDMVISLATVKGHVSRLMRKFDAGTRGQAVAHAIRLGIISTE